MSTNRDALLGLTTGYPVPLRTLEAIALKRGLSLDGIATQQSMSGADFKLSEADVLIYLFRAPNISQGGQSYSFTDEQRKAFKSRALSIYSVYGSSEDIKEIGIQYGYKGSRL